jgi:hypothetical protein
VPLAPVHGGRETTGPFDVARHRVRAEYELQPGRVQSLTIDRGWREVADTALAFIQRYV